jgi:hypothetical protein
VVRVVKAVYEGVAGVCDGHAAGARSRPRRRDRVLERTQLEVRSYPR